MLRKHFLVKLCGVGLLAFSPLAAIAQTTTPSPTTTAPTSPTTTNQQQTAQAVQSQVSLTQKTTLTAARGDAGTSNTGIPSNANIYGTTMVNPHSMGLPSLYKDQFGAQNVITTQGGPKAKFTYLYVAPTTTTSTTSTATTQQAGFTTYAQPRVPHYSTSLSDDLPLVAHDSGKLQTDLRALVDRSSFLKSKGNIKIDVVGGVVTLSGQVATEKERRVAEGIARMTPGVLDVQNGLSVLELKR